MCHARPAAARFNPAGTMSAFAPVYRPTKSQQALLTREQKREAAKRKREDDDGDDSGDSYRKHSPDLEDSTPHRASAFAPINRTDPFHVAGLSRQEPLPRYPFPHASAKPTHVPTKSPHEELAAVKPPLYVPKTDVEDQSTSVKRRHLDNLTTILHQCMLKEDWKRASRAWGLLVRTEIDGLGIDIRQHGRWGFGAEILMRREQSDAPSTHVDPARRVSSDESSSVIEDDDANQPAQCIADEGFKLARDYYERLILQYPHTPYAQHSVNAKVFYPAFFNVWIHEVQARYKRLRNELNAFQRPSHHSIASDASSDGDGGGSSRPASHQELAAREVQDATPIAERLDQLLLSPPYDVSESLLHLRAMIGLWLSDLYTTLANAQFLRKDDDQASPSSGGDFTSDYATRVAAKQHQQKASAENKRAKQLLAKVKLTGKDVSDVSLPDVDATEDMSE